MKRRHLVRYTLAGTAGVAATTSLTRRSTATGDRHSWQMPTSWPAETTLFQGAQAICDRVSAITDGQLTIQPYPAGERVGGLEIFDAVQAGTVQCGHTASYYYLNKNRALAFATSVPFGLTAQQQNTWLYAGGGLEAIRKVYADFGIVNFPAGNTGMQMGGWFKQEVRSLSDLNGLKIRIAGLGGEVISRLGVEIVNLAIGEIPQALTEGTIDAAELIGPYDDLTLGMPEVAQFYYYPGCWEPGPTLDIIVNRQEWDRLPIAFQEALKTAAAEANIAMLSKYEFLNQQALRQLMDRGIQLIPYSAEILQAAQQAAFALYEEDASDNSSFKEVYEQWKAFREDIYRWESINQFSFDTFVLPQN